MTMPEHVTVGPIRYRITDDSDDWHAYEKDGGGKFNLGATWFSRGMIVLNPNKFANDQVRRVTVLHELLHAIADAAGHPDKGKLTEERWIDRVDSLLLDTLQRNPELVAWLLADEEGP
jgi:hypothetical protein